MPNPSLYNDYDKTYIVMEQTTPVDSKIVELENYAWKKDKKTGEYINEPIDEYNHFLDSLRYSLQCINTHKLQTMSKSKLGIL